MSEQKQPTNRVDARRLTATELAGLRERVVVAFQQGMNRRQISQELGLSYPSVRATVARYQRQGDASLLPGKRGRRLGKCRLLTVEQEEELRRKICQDGPEGFGLRYPLWSRSAVVELIEQQFGMRLSIRTVYNYLARWSFAGGKPFDRPCARCPEALKQWLVEEYPFLERLARLQGDEVVWLKLSSLDDQQIPGRGGEQHGFARAINVLERPDPGLLLLSAVTPQGRTRWLVIDQALAEAKLIAFLAALTGEAARKICLFSADLPILHATSVHAWLDKHSARMALVLAPVMPS